MSDQSESGDRRYLIRAAAPFKDDEPFHVALSHRRIVAMGLRSAGQVNECAEVVPYILQNPEAIFEGLRRDEDERYSEGAPGWLCYAGRPHCSFDDDGTRGGPWEGDVYLVFLNQDRVAYNWRWEKADPNDLCVPMQHGVERFRRRIL